MELQVLDQNSNVIVEAFKTEGGAQSLFDQIAAQARSVVPDLSTDKKRKEIISLAAKVSKTKVAFDNHGKALKEQYTVITNKIDADRKLFRDQCDALRDEIRQPLTEWEQVEKDRVFRHEEAIAVIKAYFAPSFIDSENIRESIKVVENTVIDSSFEEYEKEAKLAKFETLELLNKALIEQEKFELEQAEIEAAMQAEIIRVQQERDAKIAREAIEAERKRIKVEQFAKYEAECKEIESREADVAHKKRICSEALAALVGIGVDAEMGKKILKAINAKLIPNVILKF